MNSILEYITANFMLTAVHTNPDSHEQRELYEGDCFCGRIRIRLGKNLLTGQYYQLVQYQVQRTGQLLAPNFWKSGTAETLWNNVLSVNPCRYEVYSSRTYGQPKLKKPKELAGISSFGSACYISGRCNPKLYLCGNDLWLKHTDYFSSLFVPEQDRQDMPQSYYLKKYFDKSKVNKFIYNDNWGSIVLRNEAWIVIRSLIPAFRAGLPDNQIADMILKSQMQTEQDMCDDGT